MTRIRASGPASAVNTSWLEKSIVLDAQQDETLVWLAKAYAKQGDKAKARDAIRSSLQLNPQSQFAKDTAAAIEK
jgi:cytochrome c-type biogenesis protein CcmH/NrfG